MIKKLKMKSYKSFGEKIRFHSECVAKKMYMINPMLEEDVLKNVEKLEALLKVAKCPNCDGSGAIQHAEDEWQECQWCYEREQMIDKFEIHD